MFSLLPVLGSKMLLLDLNLSERESIYLLALTMRELISPKYTLVRVMKLARGFTLIIKIKNFGIALSQ